GSGRGALARARRGGVAVGPARPRVGTARAADEAIAFTSAGAGVARSGRGVRRRRRSTQLLPGHGAHAHRARDRIERRRRREIDAIAIETGDALLIGAGPALVPGHVDVMGDLVCRLLLDNNVTRHALDRLC